MNRRTTLDRPTPDKSTLTDSVPIGQRPTGPALTGWATTDQQGADRQRADQEPVGRNQPGQKPVGQKVGHQPVGPEKAGQKQAGQKQAGQKQAGPGLIGTVLIPGLILGLSGCGSDTPKPGPNARTAACTALVGRLPDQVLNQRRTDLAVVGAAAWGDPSIVLRCGVPPTGPTSNPCIDVNGQDWTFSETQDVFRFITYGRTPAVEVTVPTSINRTSAPAALSDLAKAVAPLPKTAECR